MSSAKEHFTKARVRDDDVNILLLGESGVGKSTFINSMANYLQYNTLDEALEEKLTCLIPSRFSMPDENFITQEVQLGSDENEDAEFGNSSTQGARSYVFSIQDTICRIIDTPGIGDARGIEQDRENFENVLSYISQYKYLHGICFLLKPNVTVINPYFKFCIIHLLSRLDKSAVKNIIFIFTNSRGTFYRPGDTLELLKKILTDIKQSSPYVEVPCGKDNIFCVDNEAFKFLAALQQGIKFGEREKDEFSQSWVTSCEAVKALIMYVQNTKKLTPHQVESTLSINEARRNIIDLAKPLADITDFIRNNIVVLERHQLEITRENLSNEDLKKRLYVPGVAVNMVELTQPVTVCSSNNCTETLSHGGITQRHYKQRCHNPCYLQNVPKEIIGSPELLNCAAMNRTRQCKFCLCDFSSHMHIYYETKMEHVKEEDKLVKSQILSRDELILKKHQVIAQIRQKSQEYEAEKDKILRTMAKFAYFLHENSIAAYNDAYLDYLEYLIDREKSLGGHADKMLLKHYYELKLNYQSEKDILEEAKKTALRKNSVFSISISDVFENIKNLFKLRWTGKTIENFYSKQRKLTLKENSQMEYLHPKAIGIKNKCDKEDITDGEILKQLRSEPDVTAMKDKLKKMKLKGPGAEKRKQQLLNLIDTFVEVSPKVQTEIPKTESPPPRAVRIKSKFDKDDKLTDNAILKQLLCESDIHNMREKLENMKIKGPDANDRKQKIWDLIEDLTSSSDMSFNLKSKTPSAKGHTEFKAKNKQPKANNVIKKNNSEDNSDDSSNVNPQTFNKKVNNLKAENMNQKPNNINQNQNRGNNQRRAQNRGNFHQNAGNFNRNPNFNNGRFNPHPGNFPPFNPNFNRPPGNFNPNQGRVPWNSNQNHPGGFNQNQGGFNQNAGNFNQNMGNFNQNPGGFKQNPGNFNQNPGNFNPNQGPGNFNQTPGGNYNQNTGGFNQGPNNQSNYNQNPGNFNQNSSNYNPNQSGNNQNPNFNQNQFENNQNPSNFNQNSSNFNQNPGGNFNQNSGGNFNQNPGNFNQNPGNFNQNPGGNFNQNPGGNFNQNPGGNFNQNAGGNFNQNPANFNQNSGGFNQNPGNFNQNPGNFNQNSGNFNEYPEKMNPNLNSGNSEQKPGNKNRKGSQNKKSNVASVEDPPNYNDIFGQSSQSEPNSSPDEEPDDVDKLLKQFRKFYAMRKKDK